MDTAVTPMGSASASNDLTKFLEANDTSVTKFLENVFTKFLESNDTSVTKFL